jgi:hypothetical protein
MLHLRNLILRHKRGQLAERVGFRPCRAHWLFPPPIAEKVLGFRDLRRLHFLSDEIP